jgi:hypothetical protein
MKRVLLKIAYWIVYPLAFIGAMMLFLYDKIDLAIESAKVK